MAFLDITKPLLALTVAASLVGCAGSPPVLQTAAPAATHGLGTSAILAKPDHTSKPLNEQATMLYSQNFGGGGAAAGILLGPLGVLANIKMIESVTNEDIAKFKGRLQLDPQAAVQQAASDVQFSLQGAVGPGNLKLVPVIVISKTDETRVHISALVWLETPEGTLQGVRRYRFQLPGTYSLADLAAFDDAKSKQLQANSVTAFTALLRHMASETAGDIAKEPAITITSAYLTPRFEFPLAGSLVRTDADRVWVRTTSGVFAIAPTDVQYKLVASK